MRLAGTTFLILLLTSGTPVSAQQPEPEMLQRVLPRDHPARLLGRVGRWTLTLVREDQPASLDIPFTLSPDSVPRVAGILRSSHICYDCLAGTLPANWRSLLETPPTSSRLRLHTNDTVVSAVVGTTLSIVGIGDLELIGRWHGDSAVGTWQQLPHPIAARGRFVLRPSP
jgi:hypothetical protein